MDFQAFIKLKSDLLAKQPKLINCGETNLYKSLTPLLIQSETNISFERKRHRCDLAKIWAQLYGIAEKNSQLALVSCGVRHSLENIFKYAATNKLKFLLPTDNYPVFLELAKKADVKYSTYTTLCGPKWPSPNMEGDFLLVTQPIKPLGRGLSETDVDSLNDWVSAASHRRLVIDTVYDFEAPLSKTAMDLWQKGQTILLHSVTKGWLRPRLFGIALVSELDFESYFPVFQPLDIPNENLALAEHLLTNHPNMPKMVASHLRDARRRMMQELSGVEPDTTDESVYFFPIRRSFDTLLQQGVLAIPASVFGSRQRNLSILSSLGFSS